METHKGALLNVITASNDAGNTLAVKKLGYTTHFFDPSPFKFDNNEFHYFSGPIDKHDLMTFRSGVTATLIEYIENTYNRNGEEFAILGHNLPLVDFP